MLVGQFPPYQALLDLQQALDSRRRSNWLRESTAGRGSYPPINVFQKDDDFIAIVELAGIDKEDIDIEVNENAIRLSGTKKPDYPEGVSAHRRERVFGHFDRTISVPVMFDQSRIEAEYRNGILALRVPRAEQSKPRKIDVS